MPILTPEERVGASLEGKYVLQRILASGGMATIFVGLHEWTHRAVAVKILNYEYARNEEVVRRFLQEARAASQLKHPHVVDVLDMGRAEDGTVYLVMELLEGETLKGRMRRAPMTLDEIAGYLVPVMSAVAVAHKKGVVHRDLKPDNIFLAVDDGRIVPKLLDFGIAKIASGDSGSTRTGMMVGTPQYMAPEQARGERDVGPPADVWSMGVVLYACLARRLPFQGDSTAALLAKLLVETPTPIAHVAPSVPRPITEVIDRALLRDPSQRFQSMAEMQAALERALAEARMPGSVAAQPMPDVAAAATVASGPAELSPPTPPSWTPTPAPAAPHTDGRRRGWRAGVAALVIAVIAIGGGAVWSFTTRQRSVVVTPLGTAGSAGSDTAIVTGGATTIEAAEGNGAEPDVANGTPSTPAPEVETHAVTAAVAETVTEAETETETEVEADSEADPRSVARRDDPPSARTTGAGASAGGRREPRRGTRGALILR